jgi:uncharacterized protein YijF (DUF1287 family)
VGRAAVKKPRKPGSQPKQRKGHTAPLPLDTSRTHRPTTSKQSSLVSRRSPIPARAASPSVWHRLTNLSRSDRADVAMLALPLLLAAFTIAVGRWTHTERAADAFAMPAIGAKRALVGLPSVAAPVSFVRPDSLASFDPGPTERVAAGLPFAATTVSSVDAGIEQLAALPPRPAPLTAADGRSEPIPQTSPKPPVALSEPAVPVMKALNSRPVEPARPTTTSPGTAKAADPVREHAALRAPDHDVPAWELPGGVAALATGLSQCPFEPEQPLTPRPVSWTPGDVESFGLALAKAARSQLQEFVIYNDRYTRMKYPMGDVHPMYGVCTDVIIRAYRSLGLDLQELVQITKSGSGDPNIDHRRVDTLRKFFSRFGESLSISSFAEDYKPGDVVTYWRPQNRHSRTHIAIVSDLTGPSGRPLIIHNRGWGPQQEDGLFVDKITGHYRFSGLKGAAIEAVTSPPAASTGTAARPQRPLTRPVVRTGLAPPAQPNP